MNSQSEILGVTALLSLGSRDFSTATESAASEPSQVDFKNYLEDQRRTQQRERTDTSNRENDRQRSGNTRQKQTADGSAGSSPGEQGDRAEGNYQGDDPVAQSSINDSHGNDAPAAEGRAAAHSRTRATAENTPEDASAQTDNAASTIEASSAGSVLSSESESHAFQLSTTLTDGSMRGAAHAPLDNGYMDFEDRLWPAWLSTADLSAPGLDINTGVQGDRALELLQAYLPLEFQKLSGGRSGSNGMVPGTASGELMSAQLVGLDAQAASGGSGVKVSTTDALMALSVPAPLSAKTSGSTLPLSVGEMPLEEPLPPLRLSQILAERTLDSELESGLNTGNGKLLDTHSGLASQLMSGNNQAASKLFSQLTGQSGISQTGTGTATAGVSDVSQIATPPNLSGRMSQQAALNGLQTFSDPLRSSVGQQQWQSEVAERVAMMASRRLSSAEIQLDPPELGHLQVRVTLNQDHASVSFASPHAAVREALDQSAFRLREMFDAEGLNLVDVDISDQSPGSEQNPGRGGESGGTAEADTAEPAVVTEKSVSSLHMVDHFV